MRHTVGCAGVPVCRVSDATFFPAPATLVDDLPTAEDVVQDAFTALFRRHGGTLAGLADPEAYLRTSVVNGARSVLRRRRTARAHVRDRPRTRYVPERPVDVAPADEDVLPKEEHRAALRSLTRRQSGPSVSPAGGSGPTASPNAGTVAPAPAPPPSGCPAGRSGPGPTGVAPRWLLAEALPGG